METNYLLYSAAITCFSPTSNLYQLTGLYKKPFLTNLHLVPRIFPQQMLLRYSQLHISGFFKEHFSPLTAFGIIGVLQGGIYGHANLYYSQELGIQKKPLKFNYGSFYNNFRGSLFGGPRDIISQGIPFMFSSKLEDHLKESFTVLANYPTGTKWGSLLSVSVFSTYLSHPLHNCQILRQTESGLSSLETIKKIIFSRHLFRGAESRVFLLFITNVFNEIFIKPVWS